MEKSIKKSIIIFSSFSILSGWIGAIIDYFILGKNPGSSIGQIIWLSLPLTVAIILRFTIKDGWRAMGFKTRFLENIIWYVIPIIYVLIIRVLPISIGYLSKQITFSKNWRAEFVVFIAGSFIGLFIKNIFEEFAWRGFLTERLIKLKLSDWKIYSIAVFVWATWHLPYYLLFLNCESIYSISRWKPIFILLLFMTADIIIYTELYRLAKSTWPCIILHTFINVTYSLTELISIKEGADFFFSLDSGLILYMISLCVGLLLRMYRIKRVENKW